MKQLRTLTAKECSQPNSEIYRSNLRKDFCSLFIDGDSRVHDYFKLEDVDGDGRLDYRYESHIAFLNDDHPFLMTTPKECRGHYKQYNYDHQEVLKEQRCIAEQKRKSLKNIKNDNVIQQP